MNMDKINAAHDLEAGGPVRHSGEPEQADPQTFALFTRGEFYAVIRLLDVFAPADKFVTDLQLRLGRLWEHLHGEHHNQIGMGMAEEVARVEDKGLAERADLRRRLEAALATLELLMDCQNGCPLDKYTADWNLAMKMGEAALAARAGTGGTKV